MSTVASSAALSWGLLLNKNNSIKLANKNVSSKKVANKNVSSKKVANKNVSSKKVANKNVSSKLKPSIQVSRSHSIGSRAVRSVSGSSSSSSVASNSRKFNIALIKPIFTSAAYRASFYEFFSLFSHMPAGKNTTTHLSLLASKVNDQITESSSASETTFLYDHLKMLLPKSSINVLTDVDVDSGSPIFMRNGINRYDILIIGHQEYVTQREYENLKQFVANGGTLIVLDGNVFYTEVKYNKNTQMITLVKGHGWAFNGKSAWKSVSERWKIETSRWLGSNYLCYSCQITFLNNPFGYKHHEEQYITNPKDMILMNYNAEITPNKYLSIKKPVIATYLLNYQKGKVIVLGLYSNDIIFNLNFDKFLDGLIIQYALPLKARNF